MARDRQRNSSYVKLRFRLALGRAGLGLAVRAWQFASGLWLAWHSFGRAGELGRVTIYIVVSFLAFVVILVVLQIGGRND